MCGRVTMRHCLPCIAFLTVIGSAPVLAADREELPPPAYRESPQRIPPHAGKPLRFTAPPSQLLDPWRCSGGDVYARQAFTTSCAYAPRLESDFLDYPFAAMRLMPPLRLAPTPSPTGGPVPGAPSSQLPRISEFSNQLYFFER